MSNKISLERLSLYISDYASKYPYAEVTSVGSGFFDGKWYIIICFKEDNMESMIKISCNAE